MKRLLPRADIENWGGPDLHGDADCEGWSIAIQWLGLLLELNFARVGGRKGKAR
ncbi:MAG: hypothetical protein ACO1OX_07610 [Novosphingobium sp.]